MRRGAPKIPPKATCQGTPTRASAPYKEEIKEEVG